MFSSSKNDWLNNLKLTLNYQLKYNYKESYHISENSILFPVKPNYASSTDFSVEELKPQDCHFIGPDSINISFVLLLLAISRKQIDGPRRIDFKIGWQTENFKTFKYRLQIAA